MEEEKMLFFLKVFLKKSFCQIQKKVTKILHGMDLV